jgi:putative transposase
MDDKFHGKYRTSSPRLTGWDYGSHALYFVTICTLNRVPYFGEILPNQDGRERFLQSTSIGEVARTNWLQLPKFNPSIELDEFVIMPDHLHGIPFFNKPDKSTWEVNKFGVQRDNLASVLRGYKSSVKKIANDNGIDFTWQPRYYDRVIRNDREYNNICQYIYDNPNNWINDKDGFENLYI